MKRTAIFILAFLFLPIAFGDIGPSPPFTFTITNMGDYPGYDFYYTGRIHDGLMPVEAETHVYKLDTVITVYAIPKGIEDPGYLSDEIISQSVATGEIEIKAGFTDYKVSSFNEETGSMQLSVENQVPDVEPGFDLVSLGLPVVALAMIVVIVLVLLGKKGSK